MFEVSLLTVSLQTLLYISIFGVVVNIAALVIFHQAVSKRLLNFPLGLPDHSDSKAKRDKEATTASS